MVKLQKRALQFLSVALWQDCTTSFFHTYFMYIVPSISQFPIDWAKQLPSSTANLAGSCTAGSPASSLSPPLSETRRSYPSPASLLPA